MHGASMNIMKCCFEVCYLTKLCGRDYSATGASVKSDLSLSAGNTQIEGLWLQSVRENIWMSGNESLFYIDVLFTTGNPGYRSLIDYWATNRISV
jgi:hypothetical protein